MTTTESTHVCSCKECRVVRAGLGPGPYTREEYALIAPATIVSANPMKAYVNADGEVIEARQAAELAKIAADRAQQAWLERFVETRQQYLRDVRDQAAKRNPYDVNGPALMIAKQDESTDDRLVELADQKEIAARALVRANERMRRAVTAAQRRFTVMDAPASAGRGSVVLEAPRRSRGFLR